MDESNFTTWRDYWTDGNEDDEDNDFEDEPCLDFDPSCPDCQAWALENGVEF